MLNEVEETEIFAWTEKELTSTLFTILDLNDALSLEKGTTPFHEIRKLI